jgi:hypothetical protein
MMQKKFPEGVRAANASLIGPRRPQRSGSFSPAMFFVKRSCDFCRGRDAPVDA